MRGALVDRVEKENQDCLVPQDLQDRRPHPTWPLVGSKVKKGTGAQMVIMVEMVEM